MVVELSGGVAGVAVWVRAVGAVENAELCGLAVELFGVSSKADALKQKTPNFLSVPAAHVTTPVLPFPHFWSAVSRGTTAICSAVQPNLQVCSPCCTARSIWAAVAMVAFRNRQAAVAAVKLKVYFPPSISMKTPAALWL